MPIEEDYSPKYIESLEDLPISGPDDYKPGQKRKALFHAEAEFESDVNGGEQISTVKDIHRVAVLNLATHILTQAAEDPSSASLGDMASGGGGLTEYASQYLEKYNNLKEKILETEGGDSENFAVFVNNGAVGDNSTTTTI